MNSNDMKQILELVSECAYEHLSKPAAHFLLNTLEESLQQVEPQQSQWQPIESAPKNTKKMFVVKAFNVRFTQGGLMPYTSDPYCVWSEDDKFVRWPHTNFNPTHWMPLPNPPKEAA